MNQLLTNNSIKFLFLIFIAFSNSQAQQLNSKGQLSGWFTWNENKSIGSQAGIRYIPEVSLEKSFKNGYLLDCEFSLNGYRAWEAGSFSNVDSDGKIKPYRTWFRFSSNQFEARLGLQKINFGSALLMRPLMWFDTIDARDPLQLTDGVYGLLLRYYFINNANVWLWGLYENEEKKGLEAFPSDKKSIEYGGRFQYPLFTGEIGFSYHFRKMDLNSGALTDLIYLNNIVPENRFAIDGKWDVGIGLWFEGTIFHQQSDELLLNHQRMFTLGADYTFSVGNGIHILKEFFSFEASEKIFQNGEGGKFSAVMADYPIGFFDQVFGILYYDWENNNLYRFLRWQKTYDNWSFHLMGFWNPDRILLYQMQTEKNFFSGKGIQIMVVFNH
ncbi:hypothetical protein H8E88_04965 [candidate division KSB1 bacterium]|nr:hypothetical protein [candidate division KSB1 bacterium]